MIYALIAGICVFLFVALYFFKKYRHWKSRFEDSGISVELELATTDQIIHELRNRPNSSFLMLEPYEKKGGLYVTTHACNLKPDVILASLKAAHHGIAEHMRDTMDNDLVDDLEDLEDLDDLDDLDDLEDLEESE